ncbi:uncharacterized protein LOC8268902 [Ricinus communis]|uniref:uncharacterized protein LOC8268902 n=1 Tax=Ricinus communis TaxID=3988 RepID=UPI00201B3310|nr:uncharacterized protein LOC8268902 [Ricinus communis]
MAAPASKNLSSCSPAPNKPTNPRNSEVSNPMRRSFSGNPFAKPSIITNQRPGFNPNTPVNSPSDYPRRKSIGRENIIVSLRDSEDKENGKDQNLKQAKVQSPASSKGAKNFMSPTISAASKIHASPRKKILTERNEQIRSSSSYSDSKGPTKEVLGKKPEKGLNQKKEVSFDPTIIYLEDKEELNSNEDLDSMVHSSTNDDLDSSSESATMENDCVNLDPSFNISPRTSCSLPIPALAPLDADPSMPPYDPKTNYLSPRPQFLHYKPNPRIELYLNKERDGKQLEEIFASESSSDAEVTEEETQSEDSQKESEGSSSGDVVKEEEEEEEEEEELLVSEPNPINASEVAVTAKRVSKPNFFTRTKFTALLFVLAIACLWASVSNSPVMDPSVLNNLSFSNLYVPPEITEFTRDNLEGLAQKFRQWLYEYLSYIHSLIISFGEQRRPAPLQFANLSTLLKDDLVDNNFILAGHSTFKYESNELGPIKEEEVDIKSLKEQKVQPIDSDENIEEVADAKLLEKEEDRPIEANETIPEIAEDAKEADQVVIEGENKEVQPIDSYESIEEVAGLELMEKEEDQPIEADETIREVVEATAEIDQEVIEGDSKGQEFEKQEVIAAHEYFQLPVPIPQAADIPPEVSESSDSIAETDTFSAKIESIIAENKLESLESDAKMKSSQSTESVDLSLVGNKNLFSAQTIMGISLLVLSLLAAVAFIKTKNQTSRGPTAAITGDEVPLTQKLYHNSLSVTTGHTSQERSPSSRNWQTEVETTGESCPSEMSSFQYSSSSYYSKQGQKRMTSEAQSQERKPKRSTRRESMASSDCSMGSPSYGSFTTYEKITNKHGNGEEVWVTPVRRSSRIKNQVTSP